MEDPTYFCVRPGSDVVDGLAVSFEFRRVQAVVAVDELNDTTATVTNGAVVPTRKILERLQGSPLVSCCKRSKRETRNAPS